MRNCRLAVLAVVTLAASTTSQLTAQQPATPTAAPPVTAALLRDLGGVERKLVALAEAIPEDRYGYRPMAGTRSVLEVLQHVAADNYFMPTVAGVAAPAATGITSEFATAEAYEKRTVTRAEALQAMRDSFAHLRTAMGGTDQAFLERTISAFGGSGTGLTWWVMTTTHLHEHLGQLIAYARANDIVPPWSR